MSLKEKNHLGEHYKDFTYFFPHGNRAILLERVQFRNVFNDRRDEMHHDCKLTESADNPRKIHEFSQSSVSLHTTSDLTVGILQMSSFVQYTKCQSIAQCFFVQFSHGFSCCPSTQQLCPKFHACPA